VTSGTFSDVKWPGREGSLDRHEQIAGRYTIKRDEEEERTVRWMGLSKWLTNTPSSGAKRREGSLDEHERRASRERRRERERGGLLDGVQRIAGRYTLERDEEEGLLDGQERKAGVLESAEQRRRELTSRCTAIEQEENG
jgi:hypothetical protein